MTIIDAKQFHFRLDFSNGHAQHIYGDGELVGTLRHQDNNFMMEINSHKSKFVIIPFKLVESVVGKSNEISKGKRTHQSKVRLIRGPDRDSRTIWTNHQEYGLNGNLGSLRLDSGDLSVLLWAPDCLMARLPVDVLDFLILNK